MSNLYYHELRNLLNALNSINRNLEGLKTGQDRQKELLTEILKALQSKKD